MKVKIVLPLRFDDAPGRRGEAVKIVDLPDVPFPYAVTVRVGKAGGTALSASLKALAWDEVDGFTIRLDEKLLKEALNVRSVPPTDDQKLWEDLRDPDSGWTVKMV